MTVNRLCSFMVVLRMMTTRQTGNPFTNIQPMEKDRWAEKHPCNKVLKKKKKKNGEIDNETCTKGLRFY